MNLTPIGTIHSPFVQAAGTPIQPVHARAASGYIEIFPEYVAGLKDLEGFDRIWVLFWCDRAAGYQLVVTPYGDSRPHGVFATRAPSRPNPIGISAVRLDRIEQHVLHVSELDVLDNTPLLDLKPYVPTFDCLSARRAGWFDEVGPLDRTRADARFERG